MLNGNNVFNGTNIFGNTGSNIPLTIKTNTSGINTTGNHFIATGAGQYNAATQANDYVIFAGTPGVLPSNLVLTTWSNTKVGNTNN